MHLLIELIAKVNIREYKRSCININSERVSESSQVNKRGGEDSYLVVAHSTLSFLSSTYIYDGLYTHIRGPLPPTTSHLKANVPLSVGDTCEQSAHPMSIMSLKHANCSAGRSFMRRSVGLSSVCTLTSSMHLSSSTP